MTRMLGGLVLCVALAWSPTLASTSEREPVPPKLAPDRASEGGWLGQSIAAALDTLRAGGLRIIYSSAIVTSDMKVVREPKARRDRDILDEILAPHGLSIQEGPNGVLQVVRRSRARARATTGPSVPSSDRNHSVEPAFVSADVPGSYEEAIHVSGDADLGEAVQGQWALRGDRLVQFAGAIADPLRAFHHLPSVVAPDDFRSEWSVRGSAPRHSAVVIDGIATDWLRHAVFGARDTASLPMINADAIDRAVLHVGARPLRDADRLGAQLDLSLREGSREQTAARLTLSGAAASVVGEGPLSNAGRGSWLVAARHSLFDWPTRSLRREMAGTSFGYADVQAKLAFDVRPNHQLTFTLVSGRSHADEGDERQPMVLADGEHAASLFNLGWRARLGRRTTLVQRVYLGAHEYENVGDTGVVWNRGREMERGYVAHALWTGTRATVETGGQVQYGAAMSDQRTEGWRHAAYTHVRFALTPSVTLAPGVRIARSSFGSQLAVSRWMQAAWRWSDQVSVAGSIGVAYQFPDPSVAATAAAAAAAAAMERATASEVSLLARLTPATRSVITVFHRREKLDRRIDGVSRGVELSLQHDIGAHSSGSVAYSFGRSVHHDRMSATAFPGDFDPGHALRATAVYDRAGMTAQLAFIYATNFPIPGYFTQRNGELFSGTTRNAVRFSPYARLDGRLSRKLPFGGNHVAIFGEVLNVLGRRNVGPADGFVDPSTGRAYGFTERLLPRLPSAGVIVTWGSR